MATQAAAPSTLVDKVIGTTGGGGSKDPPGTSADGVPPQTSADVDGDSNTAPQSSALLEASNSKSGSSKAQAQASNAATAVSTASHQANPTNTTTTNANSTTTNHQASDSNSNNSTSNNNNPTTSSRRVTISHNSNNHGNMNGNGMNGHLNMRGSLALGDLGGSFTSQMLGGGNNAMGMSMSNVNMDPRRGSLSSSFGNGLDDMFGSMNRRPSFGFDMGMDTFFGRRDSTDSSTAALDLAIMEMSRRRYSTAMGLGSGGAGGVGGAGFNPHDSFAMGGSLYGGAGAAGMLGASAATGTAAAATAGAAGSAASVTGSQGSGTQATNHTGGTPSDSISQRQQQLQQQQRDLEQRQRELEYQRQQLIASMQERSYGSGGSTTGSHVGGGVAGGGATGNMMHRTSFGGLGGSLGLGSVHSQGSGSLPPPSSSMYGATGPQSQYNSQQQLHHHPTPSSHGGMSATGSMGSGSGGGSAGAASAGAAAGGGANAGQRHWWICQVCNSKAFASQEEAMSHEAICQDGLPTGSRHRDSMSFLQSSSHDIMGRNFSMGLGGSFNMGSGSFNMGNSHHSNHSGMDSSHRGMSLALGTMDNSARGIVSMGMDSSRGGNGSMGFDSSHNHRHMSMGMDSSSGHYSHHTDRGGSGSGSGGAMGGMGVSVGPFAMLSQPIPLAMPSDKDWLTPLHCFVRGHCVEVFTATEDDVATPSKGKRKPIQVGQIGIRCPHCRVYDSNNGTNRARERGSVYYPTSISSIYNATMNLLQRHLHNCPAVPDDIMRRYETLKADDARSGTSKRYWIESALSLGLVDTANGIRHSALRPPPLPTLTYQQETTAGQDVARRHSNEFFGSKSNAGTENDDADRGTTGGAATSESVLDKDDDAATTMGGATVASEGGGAGGGGGTGHNHGSAELNEDALLKAEHEMTSSSPLVSMDDKPYATKFSFHLMGQMQPCVFTEADRLGKRKGLPPGFPGLACRHCFGGYGSGRFFPSSIKTLSDTSKTLNVLHNHMMRCRKCPSDIKENLEKLRGTHDEERAKMKFGSQKAFFCRIWERLHGKGTSLGLLSPMSESQRGSPQLSKKALARQQEQGFPVIPHLHHHHHGHADIAPNDGSAGNSRRRPSTTEGLEALAAASSPKRQKL